ncbi:hypothetical protein [Paenibacillus sp. HGH0039]|nr:hypothetical protein [Paenibacillus sp. HGH0039]EPD80958.1 hypothetical protein HMPREF1207_04715 [Paenibacillus sp. HGH0039]
MHSIQEEKDHRRFLKQTIEHYKLGKYFPEKLILMAKSNPVSFDWMRHTEHGTIVFLMSASCSACNMDLVISFMSSHPGFNYCILFEGNQESVEDLRKELDPEVRIHRCETAKLQTQLQVNAVPYAIVLNKVGQAVGADIFDKMANLNRAAAPLIRVYNNLNPDK